MTRDVADPDGPHHLPYGEQERCAVEGRRIDGSGQCTMVAIRDRRCCGWVLYPHGVASFGVLSPMTPPMPWQSTSAPRQTPLADHRLDDQIHPGHARTARAGQDGRS